MMDADSAGELHTEISKAGLDTEVHCGAQALADIAGENGHTVVCGIVGAAGLMPTIAAVKAGKKVLIANKEPLVMLGEYIVRLARENGACLLPLDSEHNAIFQCLPQQLLAIRNGNAGITPQHGVKRILLTGSGGPFRQLPLEKFSSVTPAQACAHPIWQMGRKISVDSATMMNKGLELIEACALFGVPADMIEIVVHPQSVIHSMVEFRDGSMLAQMGSADMRIPIANALAWPNRMASGAASLGMQEMRRLDFAPPDYHRFPALRLARQALHVGGTLPAVMNAANEIAVESFLSGRITFDKITRVVELAMDRNRVWGSVALDTVLAADLAARQVSREVVAALPDCADFRQTRRQDQP